MDFADFVTSRRLTLAMIAAPVVNKSIFYKLLTWMFDLFLTQQTQHGIELIIMSAEAFGRPSPGVQT